MKARQVRAHITMSPKVHEQLKINFAHIEGPMFPAYEIRIDPAQSDEWCEIVDAHTSKPFRYIKLGSQFWWKGTLYVNPLDERLLP